ncbi:MAG TPA: molybdopterin cofactor-binding domain-containing protein [Anaerolineae bacterium]|nr:molybdopterin cofactor-binding domain-containing protein [Anaerolineae bacterium]
MKTEILGRRVQRPDAIEKVTGRTHFPGDLRMANMLHMKVLFSDRPHARILEIDTSEAAQVPGVVAILTHQDVPVNEYGLIHKDQPALSVDKVRSVFDRVALVIAETPHAAARACALIRVEYEELAAVTDPRQGMEPGAPVVHDAFPDNVLAHQPLRKGDVDAVFARDDVVIVERDYFTPHQEHAYLQPEAGIGYIDDEGRVAVHCAGQWSHDDQHQIAHLLDLPLDRVRVIYAPAGGAFGGREDMSVQHLLALAAYCLDKQGIRRPVKLVWDRKESFRGHHKRHPYYMHFRSAATRDGKLLAVEARLVADIGAYASSSPAVLNNAVSMATGPYEVPNVKVDGYNVYTNNIVCGAFRGFGALQATFAAEMQMAHLAEAVGMDPVVFRLKNALHEGSELPTQSIIPPGVSLRETLMHAAEAAGWTEQGKPVLDEEDGRLHGIGVAAGYKNVCYSFGFPDKATARCELYGDGEIERAVVKIGVSEVGQGVLTVVAQVAAEALGVPYERIRVVNEDTAQVPEAGSCSASRLSFMAGNAVKGACEAALAGWKRGEQPMTAEYTYRPRPTTMFAPDTGVCDPHVTYGYGTQIVDLSVDPDTGEVHLKRVWAAHDVGRAINPMHVEGQIQGAVVQAQGWALLEDFQTEGGHLRTRSYADYLIPTVYDVPDELHPLIIEVEDPQGPYGARGLGEMPMLMLAPAILDAIHDATGLWFDRLPVRAEDVLLGLKQKGKSAA